MSQAKIMSLQNRRQIIMDQIERTRNFVDENSSQASLKELNLRHKALLTFRENFDVVQSKLEDADPEEVTRNTRAVIEELLFALQPQIETILERRESPEATSSSEHSVTRTPSGQMSASQVREVKLPKINLPTFSGDITEWLTFKEVFIALVHNNSAISNVSKFQYLLSSLSGNAARTVSSVEITEGNYFVAWELLITRFENVRIIAQEHIKRLINHPSITRSSSGQLRELVDHFNSHLRALASLKRPVSYWDDLLIFIMCTKLDHGTRAKWEEEISGDTMPTFDEFLKFLNQRAQTLEGISEFSRSGSETPLKFGANKLKHNTCITFNKGRCLYCGKENHYLFQCKKFKMLPDEEKLSKVNQLKLCWNCLVPHHQVEACESGRRCFKCGSKHHTMLHNAVENRKSNSKNGQGESKLSNLYKSSGQVVNSVLSQVTNSLKGRYNINAIENGYVLLSTAVVHILDKHGKYIPCRAVLDSASQLNLVSAHFARKLGLPAVQTSLTISGVNGKDTSCSQRIDLSFKSHNGGFYGTLKAVIVPKIIAQHPSKVISTNTWNLPSNIVLADPKFNYPQPIDLLIGAEHYYNLLCRNQIRLDDKLPILQDTKLGWVVSGLTFQGQSRLDYKYLPYSATQGIADTDIHCLIATKDNESLEELVRSFWEIERHDIPNKNLTMQESLCEQHFIENFSRDSFGRFMVRLPFKDNPGKLGNSKVLAINRFYSIEKKLGRNNLIKAEYSKFIKEYLLLNHMSEVNSKDIKAQHYFLPHHFVLKPDSSTTKLRVVFDASAKTSSGVSLNDILAIGPTVQADLFSIILRFRMYKFVFTADMAKMYRQVKVHEDDRHFLSIVWRENSDEDLKFYQLNTVTYGTASASYLSTRCLQQLAIEEKDKYPLAAERITTDVYVDDIISGGQTLDEVRILKKQFVDLLKGGGFDLHKWCANNSSLLDDIALDKREVQLHIHDNDVIKALGMVWAPDNDVFQFKVDIKEVKGVTKRSVLADTARLFDPLGLINPVIVKSKIFLQQLWRNKFDWDEKLPEIYASKWCEYYQELSMLNDFRISRFVIQTPPPSSYEIHAFSDASMLAYGVCLYLRGCSTMSAASSLLCAKSRVAPIKTTTIPRLELCAALMMAELVNRVNNCITIPISKVYFWTDSMTVLQWINNQHGSWTTFVGNRLAKILDLSETHQWRHVNGSQNPADLVSRGASPSQLQSSKIWFSGPTFLSLPESQWPIQQIQLTMDSMPEKRKERIALITYVDEDIFENIKYKYSYHTMLRIVAYCLRFVLNLKRIKTNQQKMTGLITAEEADNALRRIIWNMQRQYFSSEIGNLKGNSAVNSNSCLQSLTPFLDNEELLRVGGRLQHAIIPFNAQHPIILPHQHFFTMVLIKQHHLKNFHAGPQSLLAAIRQRFWPLRGRYLVRKIVHSCIICARMKPQISQQLMGSLPSERVQQVRPFANTGVDFCGPIYIKSGVRGRKPTKAYIALFICFSTKAIHMELVGNLSTSAFLGALKRFISRRGLCSKIFSDNATNFIGARNELNDLRKLFGSSSHRNAVSRALVEERIEWITIPPRSPHFGGLWEASIKQAKHHLQRVVKNLLFTYEEYYTLIVQVEAILNSRPLTQISSDPNDLQALTPGHFLIGQPITSISEPVILLESISSRDKWKFLMYIQQQFWKRWKHEYLHELQQRNKWKTKNINVKVGSLVILHEENLPPLRWKLGRVVAVHPGKDNLVRVISVKTADGVFKRALAKVSPLPMDDY